MNQQDKIDIDLDIINLIKKLVEDPNSQKDCAIFIRGDAEFNTASLNILGDARLVSSTIHHFLDNNQDFKRFILATIGSWMAKNPQEEKQFLAGLEIVKKTFSIN